MANQYVRYSPSLERKEPDEDAMIARIVESMSRANVEVYKKHRHGLRDAHAKSHAVLAGELRIHEGLPEHLQQGLFAVPRTYQVIVRLSSAPGDIRPDWLLAHFGMAIKVLGVEGQRAIKDGLDTQDFLLVNSPTLPFGTVGEYLKLQKLLEQHPTKTDDELASIGKKARLAAKVLKALGRPLPAPVELLSPENAHPLGETFHSMAALRFGDHVGKFSAAPLSDNVRALTGQEVDHAGRPSSPVRDLLEEFFAHNSAEFALRVQLCTDIDRLPIEDASVLWREDLSPHQTVATLHLAAQNAVSDARRIYADDVMSYTPWHALEAHRPLGAIMRSRRRAYPASSDFRHGVNNVEAVEPRSLSDLPA